MISRFKDYSDGTIKTVYKNKNGVIEMSLIMNKENMDVVCVPTHYFCNMGCVMCHLTNNKLKKPMLKIEIDDFIYALKESVTNKNGRVTNKNKLLISFMGVGEPLLNLELIKDVKLKEDYVKEALGYKDIGYAISTMMPNNNIEKLIDLVDELDIPLKVHFSMHNPIDEKRIKLIPNTKVNVEEALIYLNKYKNKIKDNNKIMNEYIKFHRNNIPVEIHYTLIKNVNDGVCELNRLINLESKYKVPIKFIKFNPKEDLEISEKEKMWVKELEGIVMVKTYSPPGKQVGSSCGEFTKHYYHEEIESKEDKEEFKLWKETHEIFD